MRRRWLGLVLVGATAACAGVLGLDSGSPLDPNTALDGAVLDATADAPASSDGGPLDGVTADGTVPGAEGGPDSGGDGARDVGTDTAPQPRTEPGIVCGASTCTPNITKCTHCGDAAPQCQGWNSPIPSCGIVLCDDPADCAGGLRCCGVSPQPDVVSGASCRIGCGGDLVLCDPGKSECPAPATCKPFGPLSACQ